MKIDQDLSLLSDHLKIDAELFNKKGILNPTYERDVPLYIDPLLLKSSSFEIFSNNARRTYEKFFADISEKLYQYQNASGQAKQLLEKQIRIKLNFREQPGTGLGMSQSGVKGRGIGKKKADTIANPILSIYDNGFISNKKNAFHIIFLLEDGIGRDLISDMTAFIIRKELAEFTQNISKEWNIKTHEFVVGGSKFSLPKHPMTGGYILFMPNDILAEIPILDDFDDVIKDFRKNARESNQEIRLRVSEDIEDILNNAISEANQIYPNSKKDAENNAHKEFKKRTKEYIYRCFDAINSFSDFLEENDFSEKISDFKDQPHVILQKIKPFFLLFKNFPEYNSLEGIEYISDRVINDFANFISTNNDVKRLLWKDEKSEPEKIWQIVFHLFIRELLKEKNIDITPEYETGMGPVDFKFSKGEKAKILIEIKLASNTNYLHGYEKQLRIYEKATTGIIASYFIFINNVGDKKYEKQMKKLLEIKNKNNASAKIISVDGIIHMSASKKDTGLLL